MEQRISSRSKPWRWLGRSSWIAILYLMLALITVIRPRQSPAQAVAQAEEELADVERRTLAWLWRSRAKVTATITSARHRIGRTLGCVIDELPQLPLPEIDDILVFSHGIPVVPWLKRVGVRQWNPWLDHLGETLRARYPDRAEIAPGPAWDEWVRRHVRYVEVHFARLAGQRIAKLAASLEAGAGSIYLFGHSAGGAAILQYIADLREGVVPQPVRPIRAALTLDAAVVGPSRVWTGWPVAPERPGRLDKILPQMRTYIRLNDTPKMHTHLTWARNYMETPFLGLGAWAKAQNIAVVTVSNLADAFSHGALDDLPYLEMHIGRRFDLKGIVTGKTHLCVQRDPRVPHFLWWHEDVYERVHVLAPLM